VWGRFSPDGRWVAYQSFESGKSEIYVRPFPGPGGQWQVSGSGGAYQRWAHDGRQVYYVDPVGKLMATSIRVNGTTLDVGTPTALFQPPMLGGGANAIGRRQQYDVAPDGRFLVNVVVEEPGTSPITVILNWKPRS
jgi:Tol biopolymer transport system component